MLKIALVPTIGDGDGIRRHVKNCLSQNLAACLVSGTRRRDYITPIHQHLHWFPVRIQADTVDVYARRSALCYHRTSLATVSWSQQPDVVIFALQTFPRWRPRQRPGDLETAASSLQLRGRGTDFFLRFNSREWHTDSSQDS